MLMSAKDGMGARVDRGFSDFALEVVNIRRHARSPMHINDHDVDARPKRGDIIAQLFQMNWVGAGYDSRRDSRVLEGIRPWLVGGVGLDGIDPGGRWCGCETCG